MHTEHTCNRPLPLHSLHGAPLVSPMTKHTGVYVHFLQAAQPSSAPFLSVWDRRPAVVGAGAAEAAPAGVPPGALGGACPPPCVFCARCASCDTLISACSRERVHKRCIAFIHSQTFRAVSRPPLPLNTTNTCKETLAFIWRCSLPRQQRSQPSCSAFLAPWQPWLLLSWPCSAARRALFARPW